MKKKIKNNTGFTLAELLIVVAIIAVLVAIAIPIFTTQLEKSREATDLANVRAAYAEVMMAAITGDTSATYTGDSNQKIYKTDSGNYSVIVQLLKQKKDNWQMPTPITIGGVSSNAGDTYWRGIPGAGGYCEITYYPAAGSTGEYVSFYWTGGSDSGNSGTTPDTSVDITPTPGSGNDEVTDTSSVINKYGYIDWPLSQEGGPTVSVKLGQIIYYEGEYYVAAVTKTWQFTGWYTTPQGTGNFVKITGKMHTFKEVTTEGFSSPTVPNLTYGDFYKSVDGNVYIFKAGGTFAGVPSGDGDDKWTKVTSEIG